MQTASLGKLSNGAEAFSPDGQWILGRAPEIENYFVAAGMRSNGIASAGGVGTVIAHWITEGRPPFDMYDTDISRCMEYHNNKRFLRERVREVPGLNFAITYPHPEFEYGRSLRTSPIFPKLQQNGAQFGQVMGYERPSYFRLKKPQSLDMGLLGMDAQEEAAKREGGTITLEKAKTKTFRRPPWFQAAAEEFQATRETVSLCDYSSFAKIDLWSSGLEVKEFLQMMCSNNVDIPVNSIVHTGMQNKWGGYENDCTVTRLEENRYMLMSPSIQQMRSLAWLKRYIPQYPGVVLQDVTSLYTALCVMGPFSRALMQKLTPEPVDSLRFPFMSCRKMDVACAPDILTMNLTHTGELGFIFYIPNEFALHVYDAIIKAGQELGLKHCGYYAQRAVRIEKFFPFWGQDIDSYTTPVECGRLNLCKTKTDIDFIGRDAIMEQDKNGIKKMFVMLQLLPEHHRMDEDCWPWGGEPIYRKSHQDGESIFCGTVTTASYGFSIHRQVCLGFVQDFSQGLDKPAFIDKKKFLDDGIFEVDIRGTKYPAEVHLTPKNLPPKVNLEGINWDLDHSRRRHY